MDLNWVWLLMGVSAFILVVVNLVRAVMKNSRGWQILLFASLSCGGLAMMCALEAASYWARRGDWSGIMDVIPTLTSVCSWALCLGILLNLLALWLHLRVEKTKKEAKRDEKV